MFVVEYVFPKMDIPTETWWDYNPHVLLWGYSRSNHMEISLREAMDPLSLVVMSDGTLTFAGPQREGGGALDLVIVTPSLSCIVDVAVLDEKYSSDHLPVVSRVLLTPSMVTLNGTRYNLSKMTWNDFASFFLRANDRCK